MTAAEMSDGTFVVLMRIEYMFARPGTYKVATSEMLAHGETIDVEVDAEGRCYQLNPRGERDAELVRDGWSADARVVLLKRPLQ